MACWWGRHCLDAIDATSRHLHAIDASVPTGKENRADLCYAFRCRQRMWQTWRAYIAKEKQLKKKAAKEEKERLKRAKENAKKRASRDREKEKEQAAKDAAAAEKAAKEPPKQKKRRAFAAGDVFRSRVTAGHVVVEEEKIDLGEKSPEKPDPYAEDRRKQHAQLKKIQGYLNRAQTIVKEVRIQQVLFPVSLTRLDGVECGPRRSSRRRRRAPSPHAIDATPTDAPSPREMGGAPRRRRDATPAAGPGEGGGRARSASKGARRDGDEGFLGR